VQDALLGAARFWLDRGVDGFRVDAINFAMHDPQLRDNPPAPATDALRTRPFDFQQHVFNQSHPDIPLFVERLRSLTDEYGGAFTVAEVGGDEAEAEMKALTCGTTRLNSAYGFNFLYADRLTPGLVRSAIESWPDTHDIGWPSWAFENHDAPRAVSRWAPPGHADEFTRMKLLLLVTLRGNIFIYNGEELGLTQVDIPFDRLQDPEAIANWPLTLSRDGARTPMPWVADAPALGFSTGEPWLPVGADHAALAVSVQDQDPGSLLTLTRRLVAMRQHSSALLIGAMTVLASDDHLLAFERTAPDERLLCIFNIGAEPLAWTPADPARWQVVDRVGSGEGWSLGGFAGLVAREIK
jgi:alpha-glucosidase